MLLEIVVGCVDIRNAVDSQLIGQSALMGAKSTFRTAPGLGGLGSNHLDTQLFERTPKLCGIVFVDLATGLRGMPIVATPV